MQNIISALLAVRSKLGRAGKGGTVGKNVTYEVCFMFLVFFTYRYGRYRYPFPRLLVDLIPLFHRLVDIDEISSFLIDSLFSHIDLITRSLAC